MAPYTEYEAWCSAGDARRHAPLFTPSIVPDDDVNVFIDEATELMKGKLRAFYNLTLFTPPLPADLKQVRLLCARIAGYKILASKPDKISLPDMGTLWELAMGELNQMAQGKLLLPDTYLNTGVVKTSKGYEIKEAGTENTVRGALTPLKTTTRAQQEWD
ncbi:MAG: hypothetical protein IBX39_09100 [Candidatus Methanoperedenaceae archaeon]|nr:hypothetical protein [Candidatus Methanoperedenaceae archaeon]